MTDKEIEINNQIKSIERYNPPHGAAIMEGIDLAAIAENLKWILEFIPLYVKYFRKKNGTARKVNIWNILFTAFLAGIRELGEKLLSKK